MRRHPAQAKGPQYTGPGGKTVLPHRAVAKLDLRLVPDMTFDGAVAALPPRLFHERS